MRNLYTLFLIISVYSLPNYLPQASGPAWFAVSSLWSLLLISLIKSDKSKHIDLIIFAEIIATSIALIACIQWIMALKTASIYVRFGDIMTSLFIAEIAIMGVVMLNDGIHKLLHFVRSHNLSGRQFGLSNLLLRESPVCTIR